jgi:hypothetical protein
MPVRTEEVTMEKYDWGKLTHLQLGRYAEYFVKMEFTRHGFDVYTAEVDDKGINFVIRKERKDADGATNIEYRDVQVKSVGRLNYVFIGKDKLTLRENPLVAVALFENGELPNLYLIPATKWQQHDALFVDRDYEGLKSKPEWGLNLSRRNLKLLEQYKFDRTIEQIQ